MLVKVGEGNLYKATFSAASKTITITGLYNSDANSPNFIDRIYNSTRSLWFTLGRNVVVSPIAYVLGVPQIVITFTAVPAASADADVLLIYLNIAPIDAAQATSQATANSAVINLSGVNTDLTLVTLTGATTSGVSPDQTNLFGKGVQLITDITAITAGSIVVTIQGKDAASGKYYNLLASTAITTISTNQLALYPGMTATANVSSSQALPKVWRISYTIVTGPVTGTIGGSVTVY